MQLAITPLLQTKDTPKEVEEQHKKLIQLRDLDIIDNDELEKYIKVYDKVRERAEKKILYEQNKQVLYYMN